ncbi:MAG: tRNA pseudouridine(55) synthase TruB [Bacilli bacterium]|nr:tRNA pseudouridine(55) synthase TruB [Bacilli bacterium]
MNGVLLVNKEKNYTSRDIVNIISKILKTKKVGHTGTLDPIATGVLVVCIGTSTKLVEILTSTYKEYEAEIILGIKTDTGDITGNIISLENSKIDQEEIERVLKNMTKNYEQTVPIYSAIKVNGKKLYEYARNNEKVELPKRLVEIKSLELISDIKYENNKTIFKIKTLVSKGTYIRSLIEDIAYELNTIGTMSNLKRIKQGNFDIKDCYTLEEIENNKFKLISTEEILKDFYTVEVTEKIEKKIINGSILDNNYNQKYIVFKKDKKVLAIYSIYEKDKTKIKPYKMFT